MNANKHSVALRNEIVKSHKNGEEYDKIMGKYHLPKSIVHAIIIRRILRLVVW